MAGIFKKNDIRGKVGDELTSTFAEKLGFVFVKFLAKSERQCIAIGGDTRKSTPELIAALSTGIRKAGATVYNLGIGPTPMTYFVSAHHEIIDQSIMVTGSHNPPDQNGIKISNSTGQSYHYGNLFKFLEMDLEKFSDHYPDYDRIRPQTKEQDGTSLRQSYFDFLKGHFHFDNSFPVIIDYGKGATSQFGEVLKALNLHYREFGKDADGTFNGQPPDPAKPRTFDRLKSKINSQELIAIAFDTDGDRVGFMTNTKEIISPDQVAMIFADSVKLHKDAPRVIIDVKVSKATAEYVKSLGGQVSLSQVGHSYIHENLINQEADMAAELSGHYYFHDRYYGFDDGLYAALRFLETLDTMITNKLTLAEKLQQLPKFDSTPEFRDEMSYERISKILKATEDMIPSLGGTVTKIDGLRAEFDDGWFLMRKSGTEEVLSYRVEGDTPAAKDRILETLQSIISKY